MKHTQKFLQQRKFLTVAPVLVVPFLTTLFWALGGGQGTASEIKADTSGGLNFEIPVAHFTGEDLDKLSLYEKASRDSAKFREARDNDPYFKLDEMELNAERARDERKTTATADPNELLVNNKLEELYRVLNPKHHITSAGRKQDEGIPLKSSGMRNDVQPSEDIRQLNQIMEAMQSSRKKGSVDLEESRINTMLDKILDIQHPERVSERMQTGHATPGTMAVKSTAPEKESGFLGLDEDISPLDTANAIEAVIHNTQELVSGSTVKMRLLRDIFVEGRQIDKGTFVFGTAGINGERLTINVGSVRSENSLFPVKLEAYDLDGLEGIYVPGAITRDAAKQSSDQAMQSMQFMTMDQSLGAQAGAAGIQAAKGLFSKKVKLVRVTVKAGYKVLLKDGRK